jgi:hypothetical protein
MSEDPVEEYARLAQLRDARFDFVADPELNQILLETNACAGGDLKARDRPDDDPAKQARRTVEVEWITEIVRGLGGRN